MLRRIELHRFEGIESDVETTTADLPMTNDCYDCPGLVFCVSDLHLRDTDIPKNDLLSCVLRNNDSSPISAVVTFSLPPGVEVVETVRAEIEPGREHSFCFEQEEEEGEAPVVAPITSIVLKRKDSVEEELFRSPFPGVHEETRNKVFDIRSSEDSKKKLCLVSVEDSGEMSPTIKRLKLLFEQVRDHFELLKKDFRREKDSSPCLLVLLGDIFDNWAQNHDTVPKSLAEIMEGHFRTWMRDELWKFSEAGCTVVYVRGNHDIEANDELVQKIFRDDVGLLAKLNYGVEEGDKDTVSDLDDDPPDRYLMQFAGDRLVVGSMVFEHGHRYDVFNHHRFGHTYPVPGFEHGAPLGYFVTRLATSAGNLHRESSRYEVWFKSICETDPWVSRVFLGFLAFVLKLFGKKDESNVMTRLFDGAVASPGGPKIKWRDDDTGTPVFVLPRIKGQEDVPNHLRVEKVVEDFAGEDHMISTPTEALKNSMCMHPGFSCRRVPHRADDLVGIGMLGPVGSLVKAVPHFSPYFQLCVFGHTHEPLLWKHEKCATAYCNTGYVYDTEKPMNYALIKYRGTLGGVVCLFNVHPPENRNRVHLEDLSHVSGSPMQFGETRSGNSFFHGRKQQFALVKNREDVSSPLHFHLPNSGRFAGPDEDKVVLECQGHQLDVARTQVGLTSLDGCVAMATVPETPLRIKGRVDEDPDLDEIIPPDDFESSLTRQFYDRLVQNGFLKPEDLVVTPEPGDADPEPQTSIAVICGKLWPKSLKLRDDELNEISLKKEIRSGFGLADDCSLELGFPNFTPPGDSPDAFPDLKDHSIVFVRNHAEVVERGHSWKDATDIPNPKCIPLRCSVDDGSDGSFKLMRRVRKGFWVASSGTCVPFDSEANRDLQSGKTAIVPSAGPKLSGRDAMIFVDVEARFLVHGSEEFPDKEYRVNALGDVVVAGKDYWCKNPSTPGESPTLPLRGQEVQLTLFPGPTKSYTVKVVAVPRSKWNELPGNGNTEYVPGDAGSVDRLSPEFFSELSSVKNFALNYLFSQHCAVLNPSGTEQQRKDETKWRIFESTIQILAPREDGESNSDVFLRYKSAEDDVLSGAFDPGFNLSFRCSSEDCRRPVTNVRVAPKVIDVENDVVICSGCEGIQHLSFVVVKDIGGKVVLESEGEEPFPVDAGKNEVTFVPVKKGVKTVRLVEAEAEEGEGE